KRNRLSGRLLCKLDCFLSLRAVACSSSVLHAPDAQVENALVLRGKPRVGDYSLGGEGPDGGKSNNGSTVRGYGARPRPAITLALNASGQTVGPCANP